MPQGLGKDLRRWVEAGVLDAAAAERIRAFEAERGDREPARQLLLEAMTYLGLAVIGVGAAILAATQWGSLPGWARIVVLGAPAVAALVAGQALRHASSAPLRRGGSAAWLLAGVLAAGTAGVVGDEAGVSARVILLTVGITAMAVGLLLWYFEREPAQVAGLAASFLVFSAALAAWPDDAERSVPAFGVALAVLAVGALLAAEARFLTPHRLAYPLFAIETGFGAWFAGLHGNGAWAILVFLVAAAFVGASLALRRLGYMNVAVAAFFLGLVTVIVRHVDDPTVAALALMIVGLLLVAIVVALARLRPWEGVAKGLRTED
jgi:uncharacterized membrane protein